MSANNIVWCMKYDESYHVFYSGCADNTPTEPDYKDKYYKNCKYRPDALLYAHDVVNKIDKDYLKDGYIGVEYGVCELNIEKEFDKLNFEKRLSNIDDHINRLNKESIETNIIVEKTLASWLDKHGEGIVKEYVREFNPSWFMKMKFQDNEDKLGNINSIISEWEQKIKDLQFSIKQFQDWKKELFK